MTKSLQSLTIILFAIASVWMGCQQTPNKIVITNDKPYVKSLEDLYHDTAQLYFLSAINMHLDVATRKEAHKKFDYYKGLEMAEVRKSLYAAGYGDWIKYDSIEEENKKIIDSVARIRKNSSTKKISRAKTFTTYGKNSPVILSGGNVDIKYND